MKVKIAKKRIALIITAAIAALAIAAIVIIVVFQNAQKIKKKIIRKKIVVVNHTEQDDGNSQDGGMQDAFDQNGDYDDYSYDSDLSDELFFVAKKKLGNSIGKNYYVVSLKNEHPGVVGYDADYEVIVYDKMGNLIANKDLLITVNNEKIKNENGLLTIPYSVRSSDEKVVVTVKNKISNHLTGEYTFHFGKFLSQRRSCFFIIITI